MNKTKCYKNANFAEYIWNFGKYEHRIGGYWYQLLCEFLCWLINKSLTGCITILYGMIWLIN